MTYLLEKYPNAVYCEELSLTNFSNANFEDLIFDIGETKEIIIIGSCFHQDNIKTLVYPEKILTLDNVIFHNCNCTNAIMPPNAIISGTTCNCLIKDINGVDWYLDEDLKPTKEV